MIYFFKGIGNVAQRMLATPSNDIGIPVIVLFELEVGIAKSVSPRKRKQQLLEFMSLVTLSPFDDAAAKCAADIRVKLEKKDTPIGSYDVLIAGSAIANNKTLITHNKKEFGRVPNLKIEDWY